MKDLNEMLHKRARKLKTIIDKCRKCLVDSPQGRLHAVMKKGRPTYSIRAPGKRGKDKYINASNIKTAVNLAQRDYYRQVLEIAENELACIEALLKSRMTVLAEDCYGTLTQARQLLVTPVTMSNEEYALKWQAKKYTGKAFDDGDPEFYSLKGERMRSKSEVIIANLLSALGIPYRYEYPLTLDDGTVIHPDFTILNVRTREVFILEHFGKMGDPAYADTNITRLNTLIKNGYFVGVNLLISLESNDSPLDTKALQAMIEEHLL